MNSIKRILIAVSLIAFTSSAFADQQVVDTVGGGVVGGGIVRALTSHMTNNRNRNIATGLGVLAGAWAGSKVGDDSESHFQQQQQQRERHYQQGQANMVQSDGQWHTVNDTSNRAVAPVYVDQPVRTVYVDDRAPVAPVAVPVRHVVVHHSNDCDEEYYRGRYDPEMAQAFCKGLREAATQRQQQLREAYMAGLASTN